MKRSLAIAALAGLAALAPLEPFAEPIPGERAADGDLSGLYACHGVRSDGASYRGLVEIVRHEGTYQLLWRLPPNENHLGIGIVSGNALAVSFFAGAPGVVVYRIDGEPGRSRLTGQWSSVDANGQVFTETLVRIGDSAGALHFEAVPRPKTPAHHLYLRPA